jgi:hypothetical protein
MSRAGGSIKVLVDRVDFRILEITPSVVVCLSKHGTDKSMGLD